MICRFDSSVKKIQPHAGHAAEKAERSIFLKSIVLKKEWTFFFKKKIRKGLFQDLLLAKSKFLKGKLQSGM